MASYQTPTERQALVRRMREAMIKCIILNGIPVVMEAFQSLAKEERPVDQDHSFTRYAPAPLCFATSLTQVSRQGWQADAANRERGMKVLELLYQDENEKIWATFGAHRDIRRCFHHVELPN